MFPLAVLLTWLTLQRSNNSNLFLAASSNLFKFFLGGAREMVFWVFFLLRAPSLDLAPILFLSLNNTKENHFASILHCFKLCCTSAAHSLSITRVLTLFLSLFNWPTLSSPLFINWESLPLASFIGGNNIILSSLLLSGRCFFINCQPLIYLPLSLICIMV